VFLDAEPPQFHANIHTSVSFTR